MRWKSVEEANNQVNYLIESYQDKLGFSKPIEFSWNVRLTSAAGRAWALDGKPPFRIELSPRLMARATREQFKSTIGHEVCHIVDAHNHKYDGSHGPTWQACMKKAGLKPIICHNINISGISTSLIPLFCLTCRDYDWVHRALLELMEQGFIQHCSKCHAALENPLARI